MCFCFLMILLASGYLLPASACRFVANTSLRKHPRVLARCVLLRADFHYPVKKVCSFFYKCPLEHCTVFSNYLLDFEKTGNIGTSFFTPLWQIECTSLFIAALK